MPPWSDYTLSDLLMFSPQAYYRLYERFNAELWPLPLLTVLLLVAIAVFSGRPGTRASVPRLLLLSLAVAWGLVAWLFFVRYYARINTAAVGFALLFFVQAVLLLAAGAGASGRHRLRWRTGVSRVPGLGLFAYAVLLHPLVGMAAGRSWQGVELLGSAPDPTALGTLGLLLGVEGRAAAWLALIPLAWCLVSGLTYWAMQAPAGWLVPLIALAAVLATFGSAHRSATRL